jgi:hypothetical protein
LAGTLRLATIDTEREGEMLTFLTVMGIGLVVFALAVLFGFLVEKTNGFILFTLIVLMAIFAFGIAGYSLVFGHAPQF